MSDIDLATHIPSGVACCSANNKNKKRWNRMERKDSRITIRLNQSEIDQLKSKMADAGYTSAGAFIRDSVATGRVKPKISSNIVVIAKELATLAGMIKGDRPKSDLLEKVRAIASANAGGVL